MFTEKRSPNVFLTNSERCSGNVNRVYHRKDPLRFGIVVVHDGIHYHYLSNLANIYLCTGEVQNVSKQVCVGVHGKGRETNTERK